MASIELSENHRRSISITLQLLDRALSEWSDWSEGKLQSGVMYRELDTLSNNQKDELRDKIRIIRRLIIRMRDDLDLQAKSVSTSRSISGRASLLWEMLTELNGRGLQAYGKVPDELARYIDPIGEQLAAEMNEIARSFSKLIKG